MDDHTSNDKTLPVYPHCGIQQHKNKHSTIKIVNQTKIIVKQDMILIPLDLIALIGVALGINLPVVHFINITIAIAGFASMFHYFCPRHTARNWGIPVIVSGCTETSNSSRREEGTKSTTLFSRPVPIPSVFWMVERIGLLNCQMTLICYAVFFNSNMEEGNSLSIFRNIFSFAYALGAIDALYSILLRSMSMEFQGCNHVMIRRSFKISFLVEIAPILSKLCTGYVPTLWIDGYMKLMLWWTLGKGIFEMILPAFALYQIGLPSDDQGYNELLMQLHGGCSMQFAIFSLLYIHGMEAIRALCFAMMVELMQMLYFSCLDLNFLLSNTRLNFWIAVYTCFFGFILLIKSQNFIHFEPYVEL